MDWPGNLHLPSEPETHPRVKHSLPRKLRMRRHRVQPVVVAGYVQHSHDHFAPLTWQPVPREEIELSEHLAGLAVEAFERLLRQPTGLQLAEQTGRMLVERRTTCFVQPRVV